MREVIVTLPDEIAEMVRRKVDSGQYANASEVVLDALQAMEDDLEPMDRPQTENWLRSEVVPTYDAIEADPSQVLTIDEVRASLAELHEQAVKARGRG
jgi:putative addiction module CopG family antidote